jgi:type IV secretion system protein VirB9
MIRFLVINLIFLIFNQLALADGPSPDGSNLASTDNLTTNAKQLSPKEEEALRLASDWSDRPIKPIQSADGKVVYVYGATLPSIVGSPMRISDIELEPGEAVNEILVGDSARWLVESGSSGSGITHIFVKPVDIDLETSLVVTTNRRVYHIRLVSRENSFTPYVGFLYSSQLQPVLQREAKEKQWRTALLDGQPVDMSNLNFSYQVKGKAAWKPVMVYDDGLKMYLRLPEAARRGEVPALLVRQNGEDTLVNYRLKYNTFEVDGLFEHVVLITGVGGKQQIIDIVKDKEIKTRAAQSAGASK